jgi:hypothetical protein
MRILLAPLPPSKIVHIRSLSQTTQGQGRRNAFDNPEGIGQINTKTGEQRACVIADFEAGIQALCPYT